MEPDVKVLKFTKVLSEMDEALLSTLHPRKTKVAFWLQFLLLEILFVAY